MYFRSEYGAFPDLRGGMATSRTRASLRGGLLLVFLSTWPEPFPSRSTVSTLRLVPQNYPTIQAALDAAVDGDTVLVSPGTWAGGLSLSGKTITLASEFLTTGDPSYVDATTISGGSPVINVTSAGPETRIIGFTIQGSGKAVVSYSHIQVLNNHFIAGGDALSFERVGGIARNNVFDDSGGDGIDIDGNTTEVVVENNVVR